MSNFGFWILDFELLRHSGIEYCFRLFPTPDTVCVAVKHGLIADREYFRWIEREADALLRREPAALEHLVRRSVELKAEVVSADERETGRRAILNAGHTVAHALERVTSYEIPHGEAVAIGLVTECELAARLGRAAPAVGERVAQLLARLGLPTTMPGGLDPDALIVAMAILLTAGLFALGRLTQDPP